MISRTFASVFPRQSPSSLIFSSINAEAGSTGTAFSCTAPTLALILAALSVTCSLGEQHPHAGLSTQRAQHRQRRLLAAGPVLPRAWRDFQSRVSLCKFIRVAAFFCLLMSQSMSEWMFRPILVML